MHLHGSEVFGVLFYMTTGERPFVDILLDRRYWFIHLISIPCLFGAGVIFVSSEFVYRLFGTPNSSQYLSSNSYKIYNDRFLWPS